MFSCMNDQPERARSCYFKGVSPCREMVSKYICNEHAELFGLTYELVDYTDGNNENWSKIVTYICSSANFHLPLFFNSSNEILVNEIHSFALTICNNHPNVKLEEFENRIACLMGVSAFENKCSFGGWLDDSSSEIIVQEPNNVSVLTYLPQLHKMLFHYTMPSITRNSANEHQSYLVPSLSLEYNMNNPSSNTYHFIIPNKKIVLKKTKRQNSVATPIVINAIRRFKTNDQLKAFKPMKAPTLTC